MCFMIYRFLCFYLGVLCFYVIVLFSSSISPASYAGYIFCFALSALFALLIILKKTTIKTDTKLS